MLSDKSSEWLFESVTSVGNRSAPVTAEMECKIIFKSSEVFCRIDALSYLVVLLI